jgi:peptidyl-prolyl cis-trans isomerase C
MKRCLNILAAAMLALPLFAQEAPAPVPSDVVAIVNGESITNAQLDRLWNRIGAKMRAQYDKAGDGKLRVLDNYIGKRLLLQLAEQSDFAKSPEVQAELDAAKEAALFDLYVRDVVASKIVTDEMTKKFYDEHVAQFSHPETAKVRLILISSAKHGPDEARVLIGDMMKDLFAARIGSGNNHQALFAAFAEAAKKHSEHSSADNGGDLGWLARGTLDPALNAAVFGMQPGSLSGIVETDEGMNLVLVEDRLPSWTQSYEAARPGIREYLFGANAQKVVDAVTRATQDLRDSSKVAFYPENVR